MKHQLPFSVYLTEAEDDERVLALFQCEAEARHYAESVIIGLARTFNATDYTVRIERRGETVEELESIPFVL